jgi:putative DNA primase/helicase
MRRLVIVPFDASFKSEDPNFKPFIGDSLKGQESMEYLIQLGIQGLKRVLGDRKFTTSQKVQEELDEFEETNNPIIGFFKECQNEDFYFENEPTNKVYKKYQEYCIANTLTPLSNGEFSKQVKKHFNLQIVDKKMQGKKYRIFVKG